MERLDIEIYPVDQLKETKKKKPSLSKIFDIQKNKKKVNKKKVKY